LTTGPLPSFSVIMETENLAQEAPETLRRVFDRIAAQTVPPSAANEFLIVDSGDIPSALRAELTRRYPWLRIRTMAADMGYYQAKMAFVAELTGEVVVYCDSDVEYAPEWLERLLRPFADEPDVQAVCGHTAVGIDGWYSLGVALCWYQLPPSRRRSLHEVRGYALNNVAFRRNLLLRHPIPQDLKLYRGNCSLHALQLRERGIKLWRQPTARGVHPLLRPEHLLARAFMAGHAEVVVLRTHGGGGIARLRRGAERIARRLGAPVLRLNDALAARPGNILRLPAALGVVLTFDLAFLAGFLTALVWPKMDLLPLAKTFEQS
jgi:glycosyltransferase involved in cell wall biosynthesis